MTFPKILRHRCPHHRAPLPVVWPALPVRLVDAHGQARVESHHPNQRRKVPSTTRVPLWPHIAMARLEWSKRPIRGASMRVRHRPAMLPPTWTTRDPKRRWSRGWGWPSRRQTRTSGRQDGVDKAGEEGGVYEVGDELGALGDGAAGESRSIV